MSIKKPSFSSTVTSLWNNYEKKIQKFDENAVTDDEDGDSVHDEELQTLSQPVISVYNVNNSIQQLILALCHKYDTTFLSDYLNVLNTDDSHVINTVTYEVVRAIEEVVRRQRAVEQQTRVVLCALLTALVLSCNAPSSTRATLRRLLAHCTAHERRELAAAWFGALPAGALVALSDSVRGVRALVHPDAASLAELLLRGALAALPPRTAPLWARGALDSDDLKAVLAAWDSLEPAEEAARVALAGRVLAVATPALRAPLVQELGRVRVERAPLRDLRVGALPEAYVPSRMVGVCILQILYTAEEKIKTVKNKAKKEVQRNS